MVYFSECPKVYFSELEKMYILLLFGGVFSRCQLELALHGVGLSFLKPFLILCLVYLLIVERGVLPSSVIIVDLSIYPVSLSVFASIL